MTSCSLGYTKCLNYDYQILYNNFRKKKRFDPGVSLCYEKQSWQVITHVSALYCVYNKTMSGMIDICINAWYSGDFKVEFWYLLQCDKLLKALKLIINNSIISFSIMCT